MPDSAQHKYHLPCVGLLLHLVLDCTISWALRAAQSSAVSFFLLFLLCVWGTGCGDKLAGPFVLSLLFRVLELATNSELSFGFVAGWSFDECCMEVSRFWPMVWSASGGVRDLLPVCAV